MSIPQTVKKLWNEWDIRLFILSSLFLQVLLIFSAPIRKRKLSRWLSPLIWAFYLLADWVAAFSLGLLSDSQNDNNNCEDIANKIRRSATRLLSNNTNKELQGFWAPFLLLHLGGPDTITAFALEDNELWLRHLLGLLFEVSMAGYVFSRAFPMKRLLIPTLLMFFAGIVKYGERTYALYLASMDGFRDSMLKKPDPGPNYAKLMNELTSKKDAGLQADIKIKEELNTALTIEDDDDGPGPGPEPETKLLTNIEVITEAHRYFKKFKGLIANLIFSLNDRKESRDYFQKLNYNNAFRVVEAELNFIYEVLYTKGAVVHIKKAYVLRALCSCAILASLVLFVFAKKDNYDKIDIGITYALLGGAAGLDAVALILLTFSDIAIISFSTTRFVRTRSFAKDILEKIQSAKNPRWSESMAQYNLINYCLRSPGCVDWTANKIRLGDLLDHFRNKFCTPVAPVAPKLKEFIYNELMKKSKSAKDIRSIKMMCSYRGSWALEERGFQSMLGWSVEAEFDESLLLWHIATDICYSIEANNFGVNQEGSNHEKPEEGNIEHHREMSKKLSEYMLYILVVQPSMMSEMAGIGLIRYRDTCAEAKMFFPIQKFKTKAQAQETPTTEAQPQEQSKKPKTKAQAKMLEKKRLKETRVMLNDVNTEIEPKAVKGDRSKSVLFDAVRLAKQLNGLPEQRKWNIIAEVWVEMLSYAASHCSGHAHAARLSKGGELLMFVWFLMAHLGLGEQFCIEAGHARAKLIVEK